MKRTLTVVLAALLVVAGASGTVVAQTDSSAESEGDLDELVAHYNANVEEAPWFVEGQLAGENVAVVVEDGDGEPTRYYAELAEDGRVEEYRRGTGEATVRVTTDAATIDAILAAEDPAGAAASAYEDGDIEIAGVGPVNAVEVTVVEAGVVVGQTLGLV